MCSLHYGVQCPDFHRGTNPSADSHPPLALRLRLLNGSSNVLVVFNHEAFRSSRHRRNKMIACPMTFRELELCHRGGIQLSPDFLGDPSQTCLKCSKRNGTAHHQIDFAHGRLVSTRRETKHKRKRNWMPQSAFTGPVVDSRTLRDSARYLANASVRISSLNS